MERGGDPRLWIHCRAAGCLKHSREARVTAIRRVVTPAFVSPQPHVPGLSLAIINELG